MINFFILDLFIICSLSFLFFEFILIINQYKIKSFINNIKNIEIINVFNEISLNWAQSAGLDETNKSGSETFGEPLIYLGAMSAILSFISFYAAWNSDFLLIISFSFIIILLSFIIFIPLTLLKIFNEVVTWQSPLILIPILIIIEFISYFFKVLSLTIRISVNTATGHALSLIFFCIWWSLLEFSLGFNGKIGAIVFYTITLFYISMEIFISLLQLYVIHLLAYYYEYENF